MTTKRKSFIEQANKQQRNQWPIKMVAELRDFGTIPSLFKMSTYSPNFWEIKKEK